LSLSFLISKSRTIPRYVLRGSDEINGSVLETGLLL
jgi:hypothetical protein